MITRYAHNSCVYMDSNITLIIRKIGYNLSLAAWLPSMGVTLGGMNKFLGITETWWYQNKTKQPVADAVFFCWRP